MLKIDQLRAQWQAAGMSADESNRACRHLNVSPIHALDLTIDPAYRLSSAFVWSHTPEGHTYWRSVYRRIVGTRI